HRLEAVQRLAVLDPEQVLAVLLPVAGALPELDVPHEGRLHLRVAAPGVLAPAQILERVVDRHPLRRPERRARRVLRHVEEIELGPEPTVVAPPCELEPLE